jgi:hypothetical protein
MKKVIVTFSFSYLFWHLNKGKYFDQIMARCRCANIAQFSSCYPYNLEWHITRLHLGAQSCVLVQFYLSMQTSWQLRALKEQSGFPVTFMEITFD